MLRLVLRLSDLRSNGAKPNEAKHVYQWFDCLQKPKQDFVALKCTDILHDYQQYSGT